VAAGRCCALSAAICWCSAWAQRASVMEDYPRLRGVIGNPDACDVRRRMSKDLLAVTEQRVLILIQAGQRDECYDARSRSPAALARSMC
jgi:hypothetical protein